jgi:hypothetical protein
MVYFFPQWHKIIRVWEIRNAGGVRLSEMKTGPGIKGRAMKSKLNFDEYLAEQLKDKALPGVLKRRGKLGIWLFGWLL